MIDILSELIDKKARVKILLKNGDYKLISAKVLGFQINAYDFHYKKEEVKIKVSVLLLEALPKNSTIQMNTADTIPLSLLRPL